jgi:hypothetical protein
MKKIVLLLVVLLMAMPAMAEVTVTCATEGDVVTVSYTGGGAGGVRAFAVDVSLSDGAVISNVQRISDDYYVAPGSVQIVGGVIQSNIVAAATYPGTLAGEGTSGMTIEMGSLYKAGDPAPAASGALFSFVVDKSCTVTLATNDIRGGVVMEDPAVSSGLTGTISTCDATVAPACWGDVGLSDTSYGHDGVVDLGDLVAMLSELLTNGVGENFTLAAPGEFMQGDVGLSDTSYGQDGIIDLGDLVALLSELLTNGVGENFTLPGCFPLP